MSKAIAMNTNMAAATRFAAAFETCSASMLAVVLGAIIVASIFVVLVLPVRVLVEISLLVLVLVLVRISIGLVAPLKKMSQG